MTKMVMRVLGLLVVLGVMMPAAARAQGTPQDQARQLAREGLELYQKGDYRNAINKFMAADKLAPAALNDFNVALSYDKLNDREQALRYYRSYLNRAPTGAQKDQATASINRIEGELRADAARKAEEQRKADEEARRKAAEDEAARKAAEEEAARKAAEEAAKRPPDGERQPPIGDPPVTGNVDDKGAIAPTGDPEMDRVAGVNIGQVRTERGLYGTPPAGGGGPAGPDSGMQPPPPPGGDGPAPEQPKAKPLYKQWWFWVVVGVSAVILVDIATTGDSNSAQPASAPVLFRF